MNVFSESAMGPAIFSPCRSQRCKERNSKASHTPRKPAFRNGSDISAGAGLFGDRIPVEFGGIGVNHPGFLICLADGSDYRNLPEIRSQYCLKNTETTEKAEISKLSYFRARYLPRRFRYSGSICAKLPEYGEAKQITDSPGKITPDAYLFPVRPELRKEHHLLSKFMLLRNRI